MGDETRYRNPGGVKPDMAAVLEFYGFELPAYYTPTGVKVKCAFHGDENASAIFNEERQFFMCFACEMRGDSWQLVMDQENTDFPGALAFAVTAGWVDVEADGVTLIGGTGGGQPKKPRRDRNSRKRMQRRRR